MAVSLIWKGITMTFENMPSVIQELTFKSFERDFREARGLSEFGMDQLKVLGLAAKDGSYTNLGLLLSDQNPFSGIELSLYGDDQNMPRSRMVIDSVSLVDQYRQMLAVFREKYVVKEDSRSVLADRELIPERVFRDLLTNAFLQREWETERTIQVKMFPDRITIRCPHNFSEEECRNLEMRVLLLKHKNPGLSGIFMLMENSNPQLDLIRLQSSCPDSPLQPIFKLDGPWIEAVLPAKLI